MQLTKTIICSLLLLQLLICYINAQEEDFDIKKFDISDILHKKEEEPKKEEPKPVKYEYRSMINHGDHYDDKHDEHDDGWWKPRPKPVHFEDNWWTTTTTEKPTTKKSIIPKDIHDIIPKEISEMIKL